MLNLTLPVIWAEWCHSVLHFLLSYFSFASFLLSLNLVSTKGLSKDLRLPSVTQHCIGVSLICEPLSGPLRAEFLIIMSPDINQTLVRSPVTEGLITSAPPPHLCVSLCVSHSSLSLLSPRLSRCYFQSRVNQAQSRFVKCPQLIIALFFSTYIDLSLIGCYLHSLTRGERKILFV